MLTRPGEVTIQPVANRIRGLWYYEWFAGVANTNWCDAQEAINADTIMLRTLRTHAPALGGMSIGVNLSFLTAVHHGAAIVGRLVDALPPGSIVEITEHAAAAATPDAIDAMVRTCELLRDAGFQLALDDCEVSHPFADPVLWQRTGAQIIKTDMRKTGTETLAELVKLQGLALVCENIETPAQHMNARSLGAEGFQGYLLGRPARFGLTARGVRHV